jgi:membrane fusion protein, multidrug efflux system
MKLRHSLSAFLIAALVSLLVACGKHAEPPPPAPPLVTVAKPIVKNLVEHSDFTGRVAAIQYVEVRPRVGGYIIDIPFKEGDTVKKGDPLFLIDPRPYQAALDQAVGQLNLAQSAQHLAEENFKRAQDLIATKVSSKQDFDTALSNRNQANSKLVSAKADAEAAQLNLDFTRITAAVDGRVGRAQITVGNLVQADNTMLTTIVSVDPIYVYADIDERNWLEYAKMVREGKLPSARTGEVPIDAGLGNEVGFPHTGIINFVDNQINVATGTLQIRGQFSNGNGALLPGMFVRVQIPISPPFDAVLITDEAIGSDQGRKYVYVVGADSKAERRNVTLGQTNDGLRIIREGLKPDESVVINGIIRVRPGIVVKAEQGTMTAQPGTATSKAIEAPATTEQPKGK